MAESRLFIAMMKRALALAKRAEGKTAPNPMVGAVIFKDENIIATGYHKMAGTAHAEIHALQKAGGDARGASIAITLEPCCHTGRTGPCTKALIDAGIKQVIYAVDDPYTEVNGRSKNILENAGISVYSGVCSKDAKKLNEVYFHFHTTGRPFAVLKLAQTLDGRIATKTGDAKWITGTAARSYGHKLRARYDAIAVGANTVRTDNPQLTVRHIKGKNPYRIIITTSPDLPKDSDVFTLNTDKKTIVATTKEVIASGAYKNIETWPIAASNDGLDLRDLLKQAANHGMQSILFEGGSRIATSLLKLGLVDKYYQFTAPLILGEGTSAIGDLEITRVAKAISFNEYGTRKLGQDTLFWGYPRR
ncbi:MAG: bifunctional diaminohydroxyphosphoribosylaminopyrimidine deaminase/5-amino-6-(5-phosphoribosylamino)uracil reductase RibD [Candidatus Zixiibacteriota bacterium]